MRVYGSPLWTLKVANAPKSWNREPTAVPPCQPCGRVSVRAPAIVCVRSSRVGSSACGGGDRSWVMVLTCRESVPRYSNGSEPVLRADWKV